MLPRGISRGRGRGCRGRGFNAHRGSVFGPRGGSAERKSISSNYCASGMIDSNLQRSGRGGGLKYRGRGAPILKGLKERKSHRATTDVKEETMKVFEEDSSMPTSMSIRGRKKKKSKTLSIVHKGPQESKSVPSSVRTKVVEKFIREEPTMEKFNNGQTASNASDPSCYVEDDGSLKITDATMSNTVTEVKNLINKSSSLVMPKNHGEVVGEDEDINTPKDRLPFYISQATGLKVLSVIKNSSEQSFTASDRARLVKNIPGVVIVNSAGKGDRLVLGIDIEEDKLIKLIPEIEKESWKISFVETMERDPFSYFKGWTVIPRVDKGGMFQLIVNLRGVGQVRRRNQLLELVKGFNVSKVVHGEGETILLVNHVLEFVAYSDCISKMFTMERRHTWKPRLVETKMLNKSSQEMTLQERYFWVKIKCQEISNLSTAHKQYSVYHELSKAGTVIQLEDKLFGTVDNYMAVFEGPVIISNLGEQFNLLQMWPDSLPDKYIPMYGVDKWGFYSVSGMFPENVDPELRNNFAEDMKTLGAVGFRSGETENSFTLHFVNSHCIEQISRCAQYTSFSLSILSSLVRKPGLDKKLRRLVPVILKYKQQMTDSKNVANHDDSLDPQCKKSNKEKVCAVSKKEVRTSESEERGSSEDKAMGSKTRDNVQISSNNADQTVNLPVDYPEIETKPEKLKDRVGKSVKKIKLDMKDVADELKSDFVIINEVTILKMTGERSMTIPSHIDNICMFFAMAKDVVVTENDHDGTIEFKFPSKKKVEEVLAILCDEFTNSIDKLHLAASKIIMEGSKFFDNKFGLVLDHNRRIDIKKLEKDYLKHGPIQIETRSHVLVVWFNTKLSLFKAMTDRRIQKYKGVPSVQNFKIPVTLNTDKETTEVKNAASSDLEKTDVVNNKIESSSFKLSEREIFGFLWHRQKGRTRIRDDQVISRLVTNFIKEVACEEVTVDEDGLSVIFASTEQYKTALAQFCPLPIPDHAQLATLTRKFTLLPSRGNYGLFSAKRIKPHHFPMFNDCIVRNCGIWFTDKQSMFKVLRDPIVRKLYPALFIDCRNIFILSSRNLLDDGNGTKQETSATTLEFKPENHKKRISVKRKEGGKMKPSLPEIDMHSKLEPGQGVMTRAKLSVPKSSFTESSAPENLSTVSVRQEVPIKVSKQDVTPIVGLSIPDYPASKTPSESVAVASTSGVDVPLDSVSTAHKISSKKTIPSSTLSTSPLRPEQSGLGKGKFGHTPSSKMVKSGYKQYTLPVTRSKMTEGGHFLDNKNCYRGKNAKEAAGIITNILHGKEDICKVDTLRDIKMKRVEGFLKDSLGATYISSPQSKFIEALIENEVKEDENISSKNKNKSPHISPVEENNNAIISESCEVNIVTDNESSETTKEIVEPEVTPLPGAEIDALPKACIEDGITDDFKSLTPDILGLFTLMLAVPSSNNASRLSELEEDISWFDAPVSILYVENGNTVIEVKMKNKEMAMAALKGLKQKYPHLEGDTSGSHADLVPDKVSGLYTLCFTDSNKKKFKATLDMFKKYSKQLPIISRGLGKEQVLVGFEDKDAAVEAFRDNLDSTEFPQLHIAPTSRS